MGNRILKIILAALLLNNLTIAKNHACGWYENFETFRISMFRAEIRGLAAYRSFYYTPDLFYVSFSPDRNTDWIKNCTEWSDALGGKIRINDIYTILYQLKPDDFLSSLYDGNLKEQFEGNTFIESLLKPKNLEWLYYLEFAKRNEFNNSYINDPWNNSYSAPGKYAKELIKKAKLKLSETKSEALKQRYAYQLIRLYRQEGLNRECVATFDSYFKNNQKQSTIKIWSLLHKAEALIALGNKSEGNYLLSLVFNQSEEKRVRAFSLIDSKMLDQLSVMTKNKTEIAGLQAIAAIKNPGPALEQIKKVIENDPHHHSIPLLIMREVNKLEDWLFTPGMTNHPPSLHPEIESIYDTEEYDKIKDINKAKDLEYLKKLIIYLVSIQKQVIPELSDYLTLARAHLHLIAKQSNEAVQLFNQIDKNAEPAILVQKNTELALYNSFERKISSIESKDDLAKTLVALEQIAKHNNQYMKQFHSLLQVLSANFLNQDDVVTAYLLKLKAEDAKFAYESKRTDWPNDYFYRDYYWFIAFLDRYAKTSDMDKLLKLLDVKNKNTLDEYLCNQPFATKNAILDLKGTIALRQGNLELALSAFESIPNDYWDKTYEFKTYLDNNPLLMPGLPESTQKYKLNKAEILETLVELENEAKKNKNLAAGNYIQIGHFFYNTSYWGTSWMMQSYSWTSEPRYGSTVFGYHDILFGDIMKNPDYMDSYYKCKWAEHYYKLAEKHAINKEQKASIAFMKHCCDYNRFLFAERLKHWDEEPGSYYPSFIADLYKNYSKTKTFEQVRCSLLDDFASQIGLN